MFLPTKYNCWNQNPTVSCQCSIRFLAGIFSCAENVVTILFWTWVGLMLRSLSFSKQIQSSLAPPSLDPAGYWHDCRLNHAKCNQPQIQFLQGNFLRVGFDQVLNSFGFDKDQRNRVVWLLLHAVPFYRIQKPNVECC